MDSIESLALRRLIEQMSECVAVLHSDFKIFAASSQFREEVPPTVLSLLGQDPEVIDFVKLANGSAKSFVIHQGPEQLVPILATFITLTSADQGGGLFLLKAKIGASRKSVPTVQNRNFQHTGRSSSPVDIATVIIARVNHLKSKLTSMKLAQNMNPEIQFLNSQCSEELEKIIELSRQFIANDRR